MGALRFLIVGILFFSVNNAAYTQDFKRQQKAQESLIRQSYKNKRITQKEYQKLIAEQGIIKDYMHKAAADDYLDSKEKNAINAKLQRASKRLRKYKSNREVY